MTWETTFHYSIFLTAKKNITLSNPRFAQFRYFGWYHPQPTSLWLIWIYASLHPITMMIILSREQAKEIMIALSTCSNPTLTKLNIGGNNLSGKFYVHFTLSVQILFPGSDPIHHNWPPRFLLCHQTKSNIKQNESRGETIQLIKVLCLRFGLAKEAKYISIVSIRLGSGGVIDGLHHNHNSYHHYKQLHHQNLYQTWILRCYRWGWAGWQECHWLAPPWPQIKLYLCWWGQ